MVGAWPDPLLQAKGQVSRLIFRLQHQDTELDVSCKNMIYVLHNESASMFINKCLPSVNVLTQLEDRRPDME